MFNWILLAVLILSLLGAAASYFLMMLCIGVGISGMGCTRDVMFERAAAAFIGMFALAAAVKIGLLVKAVLRRLKHRAPRKAAPPPAYAWTCYVCQSSNLAGQGQCSACGSASALTAAELKDARDRFAKSAGKPVDSHP
ncbi:MAG: hypothetical protein RLZZ618_1227 [Pseudomonadota bacterium]|jgi:hypothetical protein